MAGKYYSFLTALLFTISILLPQNSLAVDIRIGVPVPEKTKEYQLMLDQVDRIRTESEGKINIELHFMKDQQSRFGERVVTGELDGCLAIETDFASLGLGPESLAYSLPFAFPSREKVIEVRTGLDEMLLKNMSNNDVEAIDFVDFGFMYFGSSKDLSTLDEWKQQVFWLPDADSAAIRELKSTGLQFRQLEVKKVLNDLKSAQVDGVLAPLPLLIMKRWHTCLKYIYRVPVAYSYGIWTLHNQFLAALSVEEKNEVSARLKELGNTLENAFQQRTDNAEKVLQRYGIQFIEPVAEITAQEQLWLKQWLSGEQNELKLSETVLQALSAPAMDEK